MPQLADQPSIVFLAAETGAAGEITAGIARIGAPGPCDFAFGGVSVKDPQARDLTIAGLLD